MAWTSPQYPPDHVYVEAAAGGVCLCGKSWVHREHFGPLGTARVIEAIKTYNDLLHKDGLEPSVAIRLAMPGPISDWNDDVWVPLLDRTSYAEPKVVFQRRSAIGEAAYREMFPVLNLEKKAPTPPKFSSVKEAEQWLEETAEFLGVTPKQPAVPRFSSIEEAERWLEQPAQKLSGLKSEFGTMKEALDALNKAALNGNWTATVEALARKTPY